MKKLLYTLAAVLVCTGAAAQNPTLYFMEGVPLRSQMNPALAPQRGYFNIPVLGGLAVTAGGNTSLDHLLFRRDGRLVTLLSPSVSSADALSDLHSENLVNADIRVNLLGFGAYTANRKHFWSFDLNLRTSVSTQFPLRAVPLLQDGRERAGTQSGPQFGCLCGSRVQLLVSYRREVLCRCAREVSGRAGPCQVLFHAVQRLARRERVVCRGRRRIGGQQQPADHPHPSGGGTGRGLPQLLPARRHGVRREVQARRLRCGLRHRCDLRADPEPAGFGGDQRHRFHRVEQGQFDARHRKPEADLRRCAGRCVGGLPTSISIWAS